MLKIIRSTEAQNDAVKIWDYIAEENTNAATSLLRRIDERLVMLSNFPYAGVSREDLAPDLRSHTVGNHIIFYRVAKEGLFVVRILHGKQNIRKIFRRK